MKTEALPDLRDVVASNVMTAIAEHYGAEASLELTLTTSGCPVIRITHAGETFNLTITRSRQ